MAFLSKNQGTAIDKLGADKLTERILSKDYLKSNVREDYLKSNAHNSGVDYFSKYRYEVRIPLAKLDQGMDEVIKGFRLERAKSDRNIFVNMGLNSVYVGSASNDSMFKVICQQRVHAHVKDLIPRIYECVDQNRIEREILKGEQPLMRK